MADAPQEVSEITARSNGLLLNMGTPGDTTEAAMIQAGIQANKLHIPVLFDPVGMGCSTFRTRLVLEVLNHVNVTVIRGNVSELRILLQSLTDPKGEHNSIAIRGVDASFEDKITGDNLNSFIETCRALSRMTGAVIVMTGATDIISTECETRLVKNGCPDMSGITGSGCMLDGVIAACVASDYTTEFKPSKSQILETVSLATAMYGLCGEQAARQVKKQQAGTGSFHTFLMDEISCASEQELKGGLRIEIL